MRFGLLNSKGLPFYCWLAFKLGIMLYICRKEITSNPLWAVTMCQFCYNHFLSVKFCDILTTFWGGSYNYLDFIAEEIETQNGEIIYPRSPSSSGWDLNPRRSCALNNYINWMLQTPLANFKKNKILWLITILGGQYHPW